MGYPVTSVLGAIFNGQLKKNKTDLAITEKIEHLYL